MLARPMLNRNKRKLLCRWFVAISLLCAGLTATSIYSRWRQLQLDYMLYWALHRQDLHSASNFVYDGADPNARYYYGRDADHLDFWTVARSVWLATLGPKKAPDPRRTYTPLIWAAGMPGSVRVVTALLSCGADPNARTVYGMTPLHEAVLHGQVGLIPVLVHSGANVEAQMLDSYGSTPLGLACRRAPESVVVLINSGADVNRGHALMQASEQGRLDCIRLLVQHGADAHRLFDLPFFEEMAGRIDGQTMEMFLRHGAGSSKSVPIDWMLFDCVAHGAPIDTLIALLDHGARVRRVDTEYGSALDRARKLHRYDVIRLLNKTIATEH